MRSLAAAEGDSIRQACEKVDRSHTGHVARHDFRRILSEHGFVMTDVAFRRVAHFVNASKVRFWVGWWVEVAVA
jgi:Ca2+-binding EF-hand superfamily protein